jgi:hypothetical protein
MKLAWICYKEAANFECGYDPHMPTLLFVKPHELSFLYVKVVPIVWMEIVPHE